MKKYLKKTSFSKSSDCIAKALEAAGVTTLKQLENLPGHYGNKICGEDIYSVVSELRNAMSSDVPDVPTALRGLKYHEGVTEAHLAALEAAGIVTVEDAVNAGPTLKDIEGVGEVTANRILARAKKEV